MFSGVCSLCDQPVVARSISKTGIFFQIVNGLLIGSEVHWSMYQLLDLLNHIFSEEVSRETKRMLRRGGFPTIGEEGLEDTLEFMLLMKAVSHHPGLIKNQTQRILIYFGVTFYMRISDIERRFRRFFADPWFG
ncbi:hypothetical protein BLNAU_17656 [Blattamonas nauphoetae]|uniref:Uncharacterized protein n=1 Tax=Blattamonas nauphoetae TaxID=2049346 RepID=A0ABQ9XB17_9EUKA|nr:hypothetical protein BLNAU_17656 [Blattamonas nauphoetae]